MMRLMSDLIAYLRDLLVFKAKPDALKEDVDADVQKSLAAHAKLIATDRLLEMIDQFAAAEGRMKWAPNKKLHFEVAIIKAIQSLGQATLDEVIEKLGELRNGRARPPGAPSAQAVAAGGDRGTNKPKQQTAGVNAPSYSAARVEEKAETVDAEKVWQRVLAKIPAKGLLRTLSESVRPIGTDGRNFLLGHSPDDRSRIEVLASALEVGQRTIAHLMHVEAMFLARRKAGDFPADGDGAALVGQHEVALYRAAGCSNEADVGHGGFGRRRGVRGRRGARARRVGCRVDRRRRRG
jgi:hypothetical protein